jgi:hypothetical protein
MAFFIVKTRNEPLVRSFFSDVKARLENDDLLKNQYRGNIFFKAKDKEAYFFIKMSPIWFGFYKFGIFPFILGLFFMKVWLWLPGLIILGFGFFWSPFFLFFLIFLGLRKKGYKGRVRYALFREGLEVVCFGSG